MFFNTQGLKLEFDVRNIKGLVYEAAVTILCTLRIKKIFITV